MSGFEIAPFNSIMQITDVCILLAKKKRYRGDDILLRSRFTKSSNITLEDNRFLLFALAFKKHKTILTQ